MCFGGGSKKVKTKVENKPAPWSEFPGLKKFWDAYVETFWGEGDEGDPGFKKMLQEDFDYLQQKFSDYDTELKNIEGLQTGRMSGLVGQYKQDLTSFERGLEKQLQGVPLYLGGFKIGNYVPRFERDRIKTLANLRGGTLKDVFNKEAELANLKYRLGIQQPTRQWQSAKMFTPNAPNLSYLAELGRLGTLGQQLRGKFGTTIQKAKVPGRGVLGTLTDLVTLGAGIYGLGSSTGLWDSLGGLFSSTPTVPASNIVSGLSSGWGSIGLPDYAGQLGNVVDWNALALP